jgi:hypothetical protein
MSTEHTAFLNLKNGIHAPSSGSCQTNGKPVSEQMGAQILTDGWGIVSPGNPLQAAKLARAAGSVSHDGESNRSMPPNGGLLWRLKPLYRETLSIFWIWGCLLFHGIRVVGRVREWAKDDGDWLKTRKRIEDSYEYDKFRGVCHVIPNHAIMIITAFTRAMTLMKRCISSIRARGIQTVTRAM